MMKLATRNLSQKVLCNSKDLNSEIGVLKVVKRILRTAKLPLVSLTKERSLQKLLRLMKT